jgi:hypothetical protein
MALSPRGPARTIPANTPSDGNNSEYEECRKKEAEHDAEGDVGRQERGEPCSHGTRLFTPLRATTKSWTP